MNTRITPQLLDVLREEIRLDWHGFHGVSRRARVRDNGLHFMAKTCADIAVLEYFDLDFPRCGRHLRAMISP
jgi:hypothetical protein